MENRQGLFVVRSASLAALAVGTTLLMASLLPNSRVCPFDFDCERVLSSRFAQIAGVPLPIYGMLSFAAIFACSLSSHPRWLFLLRTLASIVGLVGLTLIVLQVFWLHSVCPLCMVVDCCAAIVAVAAWRGRDSSALLLVGSRRRVWIAALFAALFVGAAFGAVGNWLPDKDAADVPPQVSAHWVEGKVTLVEIVDFQCPHCRAMHGVLSRFLREPGNDLHVVRIVAPMAKHPQARAAARAYLCAAAQDKADAMSQELFDSDDLTPPGCERLAALLGLSLSSYRTCVASTDTEGTIDANVAWVMQACPKGLPCLWVQEQRLSGVRGLEDLRKAVAVAEQRLPRSRVARPK